MPTLQMYQDEVYLWPYIPSLPLSITFTILYAIASVAHTWKMTKSHLWFCSPFVAGIICEVIGYVCRAIAWDATGSLIPYLLQAIFLVIPPVLFAASLYMVYSRLIVAVNGQHCSPISPRRSTAFFVLGDFICLNIQSSGSGLLGNSDPGVVHIGEYIVVAGLVVQILVFVIFVYCCARFDLRFRRHVAAMGVVTPVPWKQCLQMLYITSVAILVRNVYRTAEFALGKDGYIYAHEWPTYVFDGALMLVVTAVFYIWHPSDLRVAKSGSMIELRDGPSNGA